ncbi:MAG: hypothetical protein L6R37_007024 [Teloschistes peruensis]|nr:MAG: hypothetical protein L6R37_007024 [Teloschistes peruensis]
MATQLDVLTGEIPPDPDAQATVTDFLDYTEYLPSDLVRSLTLIGKLDDSYLDCTDQVHSLASTYGSLPNASSATRQDAQSLRQQISYHLDRAINARESSYAEASRLYESVDRHSSRLTSIISKLNALPKPPSRDPTPAPQARSPQATRGRTAVKGAEGTARITIHGPRPVTATTASTQRPRQRSRKVTVPGEVLPPPNPDSPPPVTDSDWESAPPSPLPMPTSRVGTVSRNRPTATVRIRPPKPPKVPKEKTPRPPRPAGVMGTNVHSAIAGISTSNALSLLSPPPLDAKAGSEHAPWMRLTEWEMAKLRKRMKKNAIWSPSETMIRRELADAGRGPENYKTAKAASEETGEPFVDDDNLASRPVGQPLQPGEISAESLSLVETTLSNRGMKLNEAKKIKREAMLKEQAAEAEAMLKEQAAEAEQLADLEVQQAAKRLGDIGSTFRNIFIGATNLVNPSFSASSPAQTKALEKAREKEKEKQRQKEEKAKEKERERQKEMEAKEEAERARVREEEEREKEKQMQLELERQQQLEREKLEQEYLERQRLEQERAEKELREKEEQEIKAREEAEQAKEAEKEAAAKASKKRKREPTLKINVPQTTPQEEDTTVDSVSSPKKRRTAQTEILADTVTTTVPLAAPGPSPKKAVTPAPQMTPVLETRRSNRRTSLTLRGPAPPADFVEPSPRSATRASTRRVSVAGSTGSVPPTSGRRGSTPAQASTPATTAAGRRSKRSAPGLVIDDPEGGAAVSVGKRKSAPRKRGGAATTQQALRPGDGGNRSRQKEVEAQLQEEATGEEIDPNEERYCICGDVSYGDMVKCDNNQCDGGEWFHFECMDRNVSYQTSPFFHITGCQFHRQPHDLAVGGQSSRREQLDGAIEYNIDQALRKYTITHAPIAPSQQPGGGKVLRNNTITPKFATAQSVSIACLLLTTNFPSYQPERIESV